MKKGLIILMCLIATSCVPGKRGPVGPPGEDARVNPQDQNSGIVSSMNCGGEITGLSGSAAVLNGLYVTYDAVLTDAGDVYATGAIDDGVFQVSGTAFYAKGQTGAETGAVSITSDYHDPSNGGYWRISLNRDSLITTVIYTDSSMGFQSPVHLEFLADSCSAQDW